MSMHVLEESPTTDSAFGGAPDDRSLEERLALDLFSSTNLLVRLRINWQHGPETCWVLNALVTAGPSTPLQRVSCR